MMKKSVISEHIFLFPFTWRLSSSKHHDRFLQHVQIQNKYFDRLKNWQITYASIQEDKDYNEFVYFYKPVRAALYTFQKTPLIVRNYTYNTLSDEDYFLMGVEGKVYQLDVCEVNLKIYKTGIGILSIKLSNNTYENTQDIRNINSFSRCIYPPILPLKKAREELFPEYIKLKLGNKKPFEERFKQDYHQEPITITSLIMVVLGEPFICKQQKNKSDAIFIEPILGHQMFCLCLYKNPKLIEDIHLGLVNEAFIEKFTIINNKNRYQQKNEKNIYGMNRFSFICISKHIFNTTLYDQLVSLVIMQRATLLHLSTEIARVSTLPKWDLVPAIESIYEIYIQFINQLYFKEVTEDIQGSHLYTKLSQQLSIDQELKQLDFEIDEVHEYATLIEQSQSKFKMQILTIIGGSLVIPTFATGFFGMNIFKDEIVSWWTNKKVGLWMNGYVFLPILMMLALCTWNKRKTKMNLFKNIILLLLIFASLMLVILFGCGL